jgi:hypothetical protein
MPKHRLALDTLAPAEVVAAEGREGATDASLRRCMTRKESSSGNVPCTETAPEADAECIPQLLSVTSSSAAVG